MGDRRLLDVEKRHQLADTDGAGVPAQHVDKLQAHRVAEGGLEFVQIYRAAGRYGEASEFAAVAAFLASPRSSYVTGGVIRIDGGMLRNV